MVICKNCGAEVAEGKFCENCGSKLEAAPVKEEQAGVKYCPNCGAVVTGNFCEECGTKVVKGATPAVASPVTTSDKSNKNNFFGNIGNKLGNIATDLTAIKSNYKDGTIIYKVEKLPNVKAKKVTVNSETEVVYIVIGNKTTSYSETQVIEENSFGCYYTKRKINFISPLTFEVDTMIKKLSNKDTIKVKITYEANMLVDNRDEFFNSLIAEMPSTWTEESLNDYILGKLNEKIKTTLSKHLVDDSGLDLIDMDKQMSKYTDEVKNIVIDAANKLSLKIEKYDMKTIDVDIDTINNMLIENLYKE